MYHVARGYLRACDMMSSVGGTNVVKSIVFRSICMINVDVTPGVSSTSTLALETR